MPYLALDLDAFDDAQAVASATGLPLQHVLGGLALLWRWSWRGKVDRAAGEQICALFGSTHAALLSSLVAFGFLEAGDTYRVRGVDRYLRLSEARRRGGLAAKKNLVPGARQRKKSLGTSREAAQSLPGIALGSDSALSAKVEGRRTKNDKSLAGSADADPRPSGDATYKAMVDAMYVLFRDDRGVDLESSGKDWKALQRLREKHETAEIIRRWGIGVRARYKARCSSFTDLEARWNDCGAPEASQGPQTRRSGGATAAETDWSDPPPAEDKGLGFEEWK